MLDKDLVVISELNNPANSFTFYADFSKLGYTISVVHTNIDTVKANEVYTHIRNRNTSVQAEVIFIETEKTSIDDCIAFFENMTAVTDAPYKAVNVFYDGMQIISKNFVITSVEFEFMDYLLYDVTQSAKPRRANISLTLQVYQSNFEAGGTNPTNDELKFF